MSYTAHVDSFARDNLPPKEQWPQFLFTRPELQYPARLNACTRLLRAHPELAPVATAEGHQPYVDH